MNKPSILLTGKNAGLWYRETINHLHIDCDFIQIDFEPINALLPYQIKEASVLLEPYFLELEKRKQPYVLANMTLHEAIQHFNFAPRYFKSIGEILNAELGDNSQKGVILGTAFTMQHTFFPSLLSGIDLVQLPGGLFDAVEQLRKDYNTGINQRLSKRVFEKLKEVKADKFIIACTELAMAADDVETTLDLIHLPELQCKILQSK